MNADLLTAYYRDGKDGKTRIYRVVAEGNVRLASPTQKIFGDKATYDLDEDLFTVTGEGLRAETAKEVVTARDALEYSAKLNQVVARGDAVVTQGTNKVQAETLTGFLERTAEGQSELVRVEARGGVQVQSDATYARSEAADYDVRGQVATLNGKVKVTRGKNQLNGEHAEVNLKTGFSRITGAPGKAKGRVQSLIVPAEGSKP